MTQMLTVIHSFINLPQLGSYKHAHSAYMGKMHALCLLLGLVKQ